MGSIGSRLLNRVHQLPLQVVLGRSDLAAQRRSEGDEPIIDLVKRRGPIQTRLTGTQEVQVGSMEHPNAKGGGGHEA